MSVFFISATPGPPKRMSARLRPERKVTGQNAAPIVTARANLASIIVGIEAKSASLHRPGREMEQDAGAIINAGVTPACMNQMEWYCLNLMPNI